MQIDFASPFSIQSFAFLKRSVFKKYLPKRYLDVVADKVIGGFRAHCLLLHIDAVF